MSDRPHPFDLIFSDDLETCFDDIKTEAADRGVDVRERERFSMLVAVGELLRTLLPEDAPADAFVEVAGLVFYAYHFRLHGSQSFDIPEPVLRELLSTGFAAGPTQTVPPINAGYIMLPRNRVWSRITDDAHAEALDGFFFCGHDVLFILGLMPGRPGFSIMEVKAAAVGDAHTGIAELKARDEGEDFANVLPGGELQGHFAITNNVEALKLAARCFWHLSPRG